MANGINRVAVFSSAQRLTHWLIAAGVSFQLISAFLIRHSDLDVLLWADWHIMIGQALILPLVFRVYLLFRPGSGHWRLLIPTREQRHIVLQTLKFYASLGRLPCPDWYAFNPVWQPLYLLMIFIMLITVATGFISGQSLALSDVHVLLARVIQYFILAHIAFVVLHDIKGHGAQISAMLNGYKYFHIKDVPQPREGNSVSLDSLVKKRP